MAPPSSSITDLIFEKLHPREERDRIDRPGKTSHAEIALQTAQTEARNQNVNYVGTEHLLLALISNPEFKSVKVLLEMGADIDQIRDMVLQKLGVLTAHTLDTEHFELLLEKVAAGIANDNHGIRIREALRQYLSEFDRLETKPEVRAECIRLCAQILMMAYGVGTEQLPPALITATGE